MMRHQLSLDYTLSPGWLQPWVDGLMKGEAVARVCVSCGSKSFAPQRVCDCGCGEGNWVPLSGTALVIRQTDGVDGHFAVVRFDGADNDVVVRLEGFSPSQTRGRLAKPEGDVPQMILKPLEGTIV